jgi:hypothetical protein
VVADTIWLEQTTAEEHKTARSIAFRLRAIPDGRNEPPPNLPANDMSFSSQLLSASQSCSTNFHQEMPVNPPGPQEAGRYQVPPPAIDSPHTYVIWKKNLTKIPKNY